jgi:hypothetical protein
MKINVNLIDKRECNFRAKRLGFTFNFPGITIKGDHMNLSLAPGQESLFTVTPLLADGTTPSLATLSNLVNNTNGPFVVKPSVTANSGILQCPAGTTTGATDTLVSTATATEPDGVTAEQISGSVSLTAGPSGPPAGVATSLGFTFGPPAPIGTNSVKK